MSRTLRNITTGLLAIEGGRVLKPGEDADIQPNDHDKALEDEGRLLLIPKSKKEN